LPRAKARRHAEANLQRPEKGHDVKGLRHQGGGVEQIIAVATGGQRRSQEGQPGSPARGVVRPRRGFLWRASGRPWPWGRRAWSPAVRKRRRARGEQHARGQAVDHPGEQDTPQGGLHQARGQGMNAEQGIDGGQKERVEKGPVRRGGVGRRKGIPILAKAVAVALQQANRQGVVRALVHQQGRGFDDTAEVKGDAEAQKDAQGDHDEQPTRYFAGHERDPVRMRARLAAQRKPGAQHVET